MMRIIYKQYVGCDKMIEFAMSKEVKLQITLTDDFIADVKHYIENVEDGCQNRDCDTCKLNSGLGNEVSICEAAEVMERIIDEIMER